MMFSKLTLAIGAVAGAGLAIAAFLLLNALLWLPEARNEGREYERMVQRERAEALNRKRESNDDDLRRTTEDELYCELVRSSGMSDPLCP